MRLPPRISLARTLGAGFLALMGIALPLALTCSAAESDSKPVGKGELIAVYSRIADDYLRVKLPDGKFQTEAYALGKGGIWGGAQSDYTLDKLQFMDIAKTIAGPLAERGYVTGKGPKDTKLLIMVYWGATSGNGDITNAAYQRVADELSTTITAPSNALPSAMDPTSMGMLGKFRSSTATFSDYQLLQIGLFNNIRDRACIDNGKMLGYGDELLKTKGYGMTPLWYRRMDLMHELERSRYFVVLMAYDFQLLWKKKQAKLLWETRYSVDQRSVDFGMQLADMTRQASRYFGEDSDGLQRKPLPGVKINIGDATLVNYEEKSQ